MVHVVHLLLVLLITTPLSAFGADEVNLATPYGSGEYHVWPELKNTKELKIAFDLNFNDPKGIRRALYPVSLVLATIQDHGPVSFVPDIVVVSHGSEAVAWAKQNYAAFKEIVDHAARLHDLGVRFEVCAVAIRELGFKPEDLHGFIRTVPLGTYALAYHSSRGYAVLPGAATQPVPLVNRDNQHFVGKARTKVATRPQQ